MLGVVRHLVADGLEIGDELRLAGADRDLDRVGRDGGRVLPPQLVDESAQLGIGVRGDDVVKNAVVVEQIDDEIAGELRHGERRDRGDRLLPVERDDEELARAREEAEQRLAVRRVAVRRAARQ